MAQRTFLVEGRLSLAPGREDKALGLFEEPVLLGGEVPGVHALLEPLHLRLELLGRPALHAVVVDALARVLDRAQGGVAAPAALLRRAVREEHREGDRGDERRQERRRGARPPPGPLGGPGQEPGRPRADRAVFEESVEIVRELCHRRIAPQGIPLERLQRDHLEVARHRVVEPPGRDRLVGPEPPEQQLEVLGVVRHAAGQALVERRAERVDVGAAVHAARVAEELLGRAVERRAREGLRHRLPAPALVPRDAEVEKARLPLGRHAEVRRLDVPVDDPLAVRVGERAREVAHPLGNAARREHAPLGRRLLQELVHPLAGHELHREVADARLLTERVDADDPLVPELRDRERLPAEPLRRDRRVEELRADHLERDRAAERLLLGEVEHAHPAAVERPDQPELAEPLDREPRLGRRRLGRRGARLVEHPVKGLDPPAERGPPVGMLRAERVGRHRPPVKAGVEVGVVELLVAVQRTGER